MTIKTCSNCKQAITTKNYKRINKTFNKGLKILWVDCKCGGTVIRKVKYDICRTNSDGSITMPTTRGKRSGSTRSPNDEDAGPNGSKAA